MSRTFLTSNVPLLSLSPVGVSLCVANGSNLAKIHGFFRAEEASNALSLGWQVKPLRPRSANDVSCKSMNPFRTEYYIDQHAAVLTKHGRIGECENGPVEQGPAQCVVR